MKLEQRSSLISKLSDVINDDRITRIEEILSQRTRYLTVVLDDIYQPQNASAIIRTSECVGIQDVHIIEDRNKHKTNRDVVKGSAKWLKLERHGNKREDCIAALKQDKYKIAALTLSNDSIELKDLPVDEKIALCFGSEDEGLSKVIEVHADYKVRIPIAGFTQSYNVSVSAGICLYYLINKIKNTSLDWQLDENEKEALLIDWLSKSTPTGKQLLEKFKEEVKTD